MERIKAIWKSVAVAIITALLGTTISWGILGSQALAERPKIWYVDDHLQDNPDTDSTRIQDLDAGTSAIRKAIDLFWTAPGAKSYLVKYAEKEIVETATNENQISWENATSVENLIIPKEAGEIESFTIEELTPDKIYYFAIKSISEANDTSAISNSPKTKAIPGFQDNGDGTITDLYTGLMWVKNGAGPGANNGATSTQYEAITFADQLEFAGFDDWRLPNFKELASILHYRQEGASLDESFINVKSDRYWSSTKVQTYVPGFPGDLPRYNGYYVDFSNGKADYHNYEGTDSPLYYLLAVRGEEIPRGHPQDEFDLQDNEDGTVTDKRTGLMWAKAEFAQTFASGIGEYIYDNRKAWKEAIRFAKNRVLCQDGTFQGDESQPGDCSEHGGVKYDDWRLPNIQEIVGVTKRGGSLILPHKSGDSFYYWSSTLSGDKETWSSGNNSYTGQILTVDRTRRDYRLNVQIVRNNGVITPTASFTYSPESPTTNRQITFDASSSHDPDGQIVSYQWDFGDSLTASGIDTVHSYNRATTYTVTLTVTDDEGATDSTSLAIPISLYPEGVSVPPSGPPTLEFANLDNPKLEELTGIRIGRIDLYKIIKQVLDVERMKARYQGKNEDHVFNCMDSLLRQLDPEQQNRDLEIKNDNALSEALDVVVGPGGKILVLAAEYIGILSSMPAAFLGFGIDLLGFAINEKLVLKDISYAFINYPNIGRMEIIFRPSMNKILVNTYLEARINQNVFIIIPVEYEPLRHRLFGILWEDYVCSPMWVGITCPPEVAVRGVYPVIENVEIIGLHSPAELRVYDSQGRLTGLVQGDVRNEILNSYYYHGHVALFDPTGFYRYEVVGTKQGEYGLTVVSVQDEEATAFTTTDVPTTSGAVHQYTIDWDALSQGGEGTTIEIDSDGDGTFEKTINAGTTFAGVEVRLPRVLASAGDTVSIPVMLNDAIGEGIVSADLWVGYDPGLIVPVVGNSLKTEGSLLEGLDWQIVVNNTATGVIKAAMATAADTLTGEGSLIFLNFVVSRVAVHGDSSALSFKRMLSNEFQPTAIDGSVTVATYGDVSDDGNITSYDASLILQHCVKLIDLESPPYPPYALSVADVTSYKGATAYDASYVLRCAAGIIDRFPVEERYIKLSQPKPIVGHKVIGLGTIIRMADGSLSVPIVIDQMEGVFSGEMELRFDPSAVRPIGIHKANLTRNYFLVSRVSEGVLRIAFALVEPSEGLGEVALVHLMPFGEVKEGLFSLRAVKLNEGEFSVEIASEVKVLLLEGFRLFQNYPNPFNSITTIEYQLPVEAEVRLEIYNLRGQKVKQLVNQQQKVGYYTVRWDGMDQTGREAAAGIYLYRIRAGKFSQSRKMLLLK